MINILTQKKFLKNNKKPNQKKVWNTIGKSWHEYIAKDIPLVKKFLKNKRRLIIDLGCGSGRNMIASSDIEYYAIDFSQKQIKQTKEYVKKNNINAKLFIQDIAKLNKKIFKDNMFDAGIFIAALHCIPKEAERKKSLEEFYRILKPKAEAIITVWNAEDKRFNAVNNHGDVYLSWRQNNKEYMRYYYLYHKKELLSLLKSVGFTIKKFYSPTTKDRFSRKNWIIKVRK